MTGLDQLGSLEFQFGDGLPDAIERILRDAICDGRLAPGLRLREQDLAARFEVSSTPVREAIRRLSHAGLVEVIPRRGAAVAGVGWDEVCALLELREVVESHVVRKAAASPLPGDRLAEVEAVLAQMEVHLDDPDHDEFVKLDTQFHTMLVRLGDNEALEQADEIAQRQLKRARALFHSPSAPVRVKESHQQHVDIIAAIKAADPDAAEGALRAHVGSVRESLRALFEETDKP